MNAADRCDFHIIGPDGRIIGESVLNEIDTTARSANLRICLFHPDTFGKGIGSWAIEKTLGFAFDELHLHRVALDVFSFNSRAERAYRKAGFQREGVLRDALWTGTDENSAVIPCDLQKAGSRSLKEPLLPV